MERHAVREHAGNISSTAGPGTAGVDPTEFAEYLRAERERRRLTLDQIADETKIASRHLAALERGDVRNWPGGMYRRAMMRAYAESIGVDREFALKQFEQAFDTAPAPTDVPPPPPEAPRLLPNWRPSPIQVRAAAASILFTVAVFAGWNLAGRLTTSDPEVASMAAAAPVATPAIQSEPAAANEPRPPAVAVASPRDTAATSGVAASRPLATEGSLLVTSEPQGARVTVNGIGWGETPVTIRHLAFGQKRIRLTMQDHLSQERVVSLGPDRSSANVRLKLHRRD